VARQPEIREVFIAPDVDPIAVGVRIGDVLHAERIFGVDPETGRLGEGIDRQLALAHQNVRRFAEAAGASVDNVAQVSFFLKDWDHRPNINGPWVELFPDAEDRPTYKFMLADLPGEALVQLEVWGVAGARRQVVQIPGVAHTNPIPMAVKIGGRLFSSRILPFDPADGKPPADVERQVEVLLGNVQAVLDAAGATPEALGQVRFFVADRARLPRLQQAWDARFGGRGSTVFHSVHYPQTPALQVYAEIIAGV
jgi:2-iminobutanoate/2-iminopropanoate deaminase